VSAATKYVWCGATGTGTGADFTNAYTDLPSLVRGDTYVVAGSTTCTYPEHNFNTAESGTTLITVRHANATDDGGVAGWQASFGTATAKWSSARWIFRQGYYLMDGRFGTPGTAGSFGFLLQHDLSVSQLSAAFVFFGNGDPTTNNITIKYVEIDGVACCSIPDATQGTNAFECGRESTGNAVLFDHVYAHDLTGGPFIFADWSNVTIQYSWFARNRSTPAQHSEGISANNLDNLISRYNVWESISGTGVWVALNFLNDNWQIYGERVFAVPNQGRCDATGCAYGSGALTTNAISPDGLTNLKFYNNSFSGIKNTAGNASGVHCLGGTICTAWDVKNNLWWDSGDADLGLPGEHDYNTLLDTSKASGITLGANDSETPTGASNPFVNSAAKNFHLIANTTAGTNLSTPYNFDPDGVVRSTWSRGAFEYIPAGGGGAPGTSYNPISLTFAEMPVGHGTVTQTITLTNAGDANLTVSSVVASGTNAADFHVTSTCVSASPIAASGTCTITIYFNPAAAGARSGSVTVTSDAASSPDALTLSGTAVTKSSIALVGVPQ